MVRKCFFEPFSNQLILINRHGSLSLNIGLNEVSPHLALVPVLHFAAVLFSDALVLSSDFRHESTHVGLRLGIHLHVHRAGADLVTQGCKLLQDAESKVKVDFETKMTGGNKTL